MKSSFNYKLLIALLFALVSNVIINSINNNDLIFVVTASSTSSSTSSSSSSSSSTGEVEVGASSSSSSSCGIIPTIRMHNGVEMPVLSLGTCHLIHDPAMKKPDLDRPNQFLGLLPELTYRQMEIALQNGMRSFDTAYIYRSHKPMSYVLGEWYRTGQLQKRSDVFITSKIFHPDATSITFHTSHMPKQHEMSIDDIESLTRYHFEQSLIELNVGYIDLMLLHWPSGKDLGNEMDNRKRRITAWKVLEDTYKHGWTRSIGVSNFSPTHIEQLKMDGATIIPMINQFEASITLQYKDLLKYCIDNQIIPQAYSPLGRGGNALLEELPQFVSTIATKYNKDIGQIALRYLYQLGYAITYLTTSEKRIISNTEIFDFELSKEEIQQLDTLNQPNGGWGVPSPYDLK